MMNEDEFKNSLKLIKHKFFDNNTDYDVNILRVMCPKQLYEPSTVLSLWSKYIKKSKHQPINFYIHIPYCISKCFYCTCYLRVTNDKEINNYVDNLISYLDSFEKIFDKTVFSNLYIGGGTPSIISDSNFDRLLNYVLNHFKFENDGEKCCEMNPLSASESKIVILKKHQFNRISFGVQSLDPKVLELNNRGYQSEEMVKRAVMMAKRAGFRNINTDLILGLFGDTKMKFLETYKKILAIRPQSISVYSMQPSGQYLKKYFHSRLEEFDAFWSHLAKTCLGEISSLAKKAGYDVPDYSKLYLKMLSPHCWRYNDLSIKNKLKKNYHFDELNTSVFGSGEGSNSKISKILYYTTNKFDRNIKSCIFSGLKRSHRIEMIDYIINTFSYSKFISLPYFKKKFEVNITEEFKSEIERLLKLKAIRIDTDKLYFISQNKKERRLLLFNFFKIEDIKNVLKKNFNFHEIKTPFKKIDSYLKDKKKLIQYKNLSEEIRFNFKSVNKIIDGIFVKKKSDHLLIIDDKGKKLNIVITDNCFFTREYHKDNKVIYEEKITPKDIFVQDGYPIPLVLFMKKGYKNNAILVKRIVSYS